MDAGPAEDPSATFHHGRGQDGYTDMGETSDMDISGMADIALIHVLDFLGSPDGGGPILTTHINGLIYQHRIQA